MTIKEREIAGAIFETKLDLSHPINFECLTQYIAF
jgi:hypothetical protein